MSLNAYRTINAKHMTDCQKNLQLKTRRRSRRTYNGFGFLVIRGFKYDETVINLLFIEF